jgi:hypothetical protein
MADDRYIPTIQQIIAKGDSIGTVPMSSDESRRWFVEVCRENRERLERDNDN